ncbi:MAG: hypothetical protein NTV24_04865, partial [Candidatus Woesebacteria bacterium]|nr:hypothetical protein [Candidatus Woesebacteria bacterium]
KLSAVFCAILFVFSPKLAGYIEAGHFGLILSWAWLPWLFLSTVMIAKRTKLIWSLVLAISSAALFYTHATTFIYAIFFACLIFIVTFLKVENKVKALFFFILGGILSFGLSAVAILPQIAWISQTNRYLLAIKPEVWPIWNSKLEFIKQMFLPANSDPEKWIPIGLISAVLALFGYLSLKKSQKIYLALLAIPVFIIAANNATPFYKTLISQKWYDYMRVSTRIWFAVSLTVIFLAGIGLQRIKHFRLLFCLALIETLALSWFRLTKPSPQPNYAPKEVYEFLARDKDRFRVYCLSRCLSQKEATIYHLELIDGYSTLIQKNYNSHALQLTGAYWDYYTLSIPPMGAYLNEKLNPNINSLGRYNTKYIISPYILESNDLSLATKIDKYFIYKNLKYQPRSEAPITYYSPNLIKIDTSNYHKDALVISEVYNPGWKAYTDTGKETQLLESPNVLRSIAVPKETKYLEIKYEPPNYKIGETITLSTLLTVIIIYLIKKYWRKA